MGFDFNSRQHRLLRGEDDLLEERDAGPEVDAEGNHNRTITHSTAPWEDLIGTQRAAGTPGTGQGAENWNGDGKGDS